ncbi:glycosyltransferase family 4 protein [Seonamhaeicola maritimus]|uniref:glycosyltransferase family 4 protein n=1 Tax=Seonamhaeicola maritimus TaxID=2591822 RepID=UPI002493F324|nr:glycosyltransferase family 4 protein [Seonamhaeicola maritimus]
MRKKALIITYYWPPAGGPGVQRWLKFVKYLPQFDVEPIVFIPENPNYALRDESLVDEVSDETKILRLPIKEPYKLARFLSRKKSKTISKGIISETKNQSLVEKIMLYVRGNFFIPDARKNWVSPSVEYLSSFISKENIETIITTGPPHSLHLIGMHLKDNLGVRWIADFRDPWTTIGYHKKLKLTRRSRKKHLFLEKSVLNNADQVIVTSFVTKNEFSEITNKPIEVITNGYDYESVKLVELDTKFSLAHIGSLLSKRNPEILWQVLHDLIHEESGFSSDFRLNFIGAVSDEVIISIEKYCLSDYTSNMGYVSHKESVKFQKKSQTLLLIEIDSEETKCIIPGKLFEYMVSERPIVAIGPKDSDVEKIIKETNTGSYFNYGNYDSLKTTILSHYKAYKNGSLKSYPIGLQKYSRKELTKSLSKLI